MADSTGLEHDTQYWKSLYEELSIKYGDLKEEQNEFMNNARELEEELEAHLKNAEKRSDELLSANERLHHDLENYKIMSEERMQTLSKEVNKLQDENKNLLADIDKCQNYIRELEQSNDDLERAKRLAAGSIDNFEAQLNYAIERNVFLETEKEELVEAVQRLKDESRDLHQELTAVQKRKELFEKTPLSIDKSDAAHDCCSCIDSEQSKQMRIENISKIVQTDDHASSTTSSSHLDSQFSYNSSAKLRPMSPAMRITALNAVTELLRKVGALETKLNSVMINQHNGMPASYPINGSKRTSSTIIRSQGNSFRNSDHNSQENQPPPESSSPIKTPK